jgi:hypothetical protein
MKDFHLSQNIKRAMLHIETNPQYAKTFLIAALKTSLTALTLRVGTRSRCSKVARLSLMKTPMVGMSLPSTPARRRAGNFPQLIHNLFIYDVMKLLPIFPFLPLTNNPV